MLTPEQVQRIRAWTDVPDETVAALCDTVDELRRLVRIQWECEQVYLEDEDVAAIRAAIGE